MRKMNPWARSLDKNMTRVAMRLTTQLLGAAPADRL